MVTPFHFTSADVMRLSPLASPLTMRSVKGPVSQVGLVTVSLNWFGGPEVRV